MALSDLLWACPECGDVGALDPEGRCARCATVFTRHRGAAVRAVFPDGRSIVRSPAQWLDRMPDPGALLDAGGEGPVRVARVLARVATGTRPVRDGGVYLNRIEVYGPAAEGTLELALDRLTHRPEGSGSTQWLFDDLTAVQASSTTLQLKARARPLVAFRFLDDSIYFWETLVRAALRRHFLRAGRGQIVEFQPRIVTR